MAISLINMIEQITNDYPDKFRIALSPKDIVENKLDGIISLPLGMENGSGLENDLSNVSFFYKKGIRYITLTHAKSNLISDSSYDENEKKVRVL